MNITGIARDCSLTSLDRCPGFVLLHEHVRERNVQRCTTRLERTGAPQGRFCLVVLPPRGESAAQTEPMHGVGRLEFGRTGERSGRVLEQPGLQLALTETRPF